MKWAAAKANRRHTRKRRRAYRMTMRSGVNPSPHTRPNGRIGKSRHGRTPPK